MELSFEKRIGEIKLTCEEKYYSTFTEFLTAEEKAQAEQFTFMRSGTHKFFGGYAEAERTMLGFFPPYTEEIDMSEYPIKLLKVKGSGYKELAHRDFLGTVLSLGIRRECVGDIVCDKENSTGYIFVHENVSRYICDNLDRIGGDKVCVCEIPFYDLPEIQKNYSVLNDTVSSLRLDGVVSGCINVSRDKAEKLISSCNVSINHLVCQKRIKGCVSEIYSP